MPAVRKPGEQYVIAGGQADHAGADLLHHARTLVSDHDGQRGRMDALGGVQV